MKIASKRAARREARRCVPVAACLALIALPVSGCGSDDGNDSGEKGGGAPAAKSAVTVNIASFKFAEASVKVETGGTVTFVNEDKAPHTAQTDLDPKAAEFDTGRLTTGDKKAVKLAKAGKLQYFCAYHAFMKGTVEVVH